MKNAPKKIFFKMLSMCVAALIVVMLMSGCSAIAQGDDTVNIQGALILPNGRVIPEGAYGIVYIPSPLVGTLLQLRGITGNGTIYGREISSCFEIPTRLAAGDFGGESIAINDSEAIELVIYSQDVMNILTAGNEVVSDHFRVSSDELTNQAGDQSDAQNSDIQILTGLEASTGFVVNPGEWSWSSLFGVSRQPITCSGANMK
ncbi:hypothetical protein BOO92_21010 [Vibrio navarrensis]|nr:hypothetical protein [Vibrio navarrensis]